jgi:hypothetical protein
MRISLDSRRAAAVRKDRTFRIIETLTLDALFGVVGDADVTVEKLLSLQVNQRSRINGVLIVRTA